MFSYGVQRRDVIRGGLALAALATTARAAAGPRARIGIIGSGKIGGALGRLWAQAGYPVMLSARNLGPVQALVAEIGHGAKAGTPQQAAAFGEVLVISVPWSAVAQVGKDYAAEMKGKVVMDTSNPYVIRDGPQAQVALDTGTGLTNQALLPGARLVRAFNSIRAPDIPKHAHRAGEKVAIALGGNDGAALLEASQLVTDAGFDPVVVGNLASSRQFDNGAPNYVKILTAEQMRTAMTVAP